ncbi:hypothetical protein [Mesorhizobium sp. KR2-14]|uniref:hypothetical protein n=1 Tax=Mesorhizobium sp. KR2-14 TaxID=3156610 RepID=UPI0032B34DE9
MEKTSSRSAWHESADAAVSNPPVEAQSKQKARLLDFPQALAPPISWRGEAISRLISAFLH